MTKAAILKYEKNGETEVIWKDNVLIMRRGPEGFHWCNTDTKRLERVENPVFQDAFRMAFDKVREIILS